MNLNNIMFVPPMNTNSAAANMLITPGGGHYMGGGGGGAGAQHHHHHHPHAVNMNASAMYHMRHHMNANYHQAPRFMGHHPGQQSPPQRSGFSYYHQGPRHYYNPAMMNQRPPAPPNTNNNGGGNYKWHGHTYVASQKPAATAKDKTATEDSTSTQVSSNVAPPTSGDHNKPPAVPQPLQKKQPQQPQKSDKFDKVLNKQLTKFPKIKRSDSKSSMKSSTTLVAVAVATAAAATSTSTCVKVINKDIKQRDQQKKKNDTMQRNSSKASHSSSSPSSTTTTTTSTSTPPTSNSKSHNHSSSHTSSPNGNSKNNHDSSDSGISGHGHHGGHHQGSAASGKQRKSRGSSKRQDGAAISNTNANPSSGNGQQQKQRGGTTSGFTVNDWLQNDMYCYERRFISSCGEDNMIASRHNPAHRNSTSSEAAGSDDLNSSSSNEDLCHTYIVQNKTAKKSSKSRQKRQQKRKQHCNGSANGNTHNSNASPDLQPMDIDEDYKENHKPHGPHGHAGGKQQSSTAAINLRKQCTKAAALKAVLNNSKLTKCPGNVLTTSASNSSVCSSLSSASSTTSINSSLSSSASSSPAHSANSSPTASPTASKRNADHLKKVAQALVPPLRQFTKLNLNESEMIQQMRRYIIDPSLLKVYGFPVESVHHEGCIEIYKCLPKHLAEEAVTKDNQRHHRHFYGRKKSSVINAYDGLSGGSQQWSNSTTAIDSGHGSGDSSPRFTDSDSSEMGEDEVSCAANAPVMAFYTPDGVYQIFSEYDNSVEKQCVRCSKMFEVSAEGEYLTYEACTYHWGKSNNVYNGKCYVNIYSCCQGEETSEGCSQHSLHVWNGAVVGINGPYSDFVHTKPRSEKQKHKNPKIYAIDCEMSYTGLGLEVTKVSVVGYDGSLVYEHFVRPQAEIVDYNTRFSGITEKDLSPDSNNSIKTFAQVQQDLLKLFDADTILIGHGLDNDLRVLRLVHKTIVDTSLIFSHSTGYPYRRSLKNLTKSFLKRDIQCSDLGHSSFEDSRACLELMMWKVRKDLRHWSYQ